VPEAPYDDLLIRGPIVTRGASIIAITPSRGHVKWATLDEAPDLADRKAGLLYDALRQAGKHALPSGRQPKISVPALAKDQTNRYLVVHGIWFDRQAHDPDASRRH
jgi:hypothetical protein